MYFDFSIYYLLTDTTFDDIVLGQSLKLAFKYPYPQSEVDKRSGLQKIM